MLMTRLDFYKVFPSDWDVTLTTPSNAEVKNNGLTHPFPNTSFSVVFKELSFTSEAQKS